MKEQRKIAVITGGSSGIGRGAAQSLIAAGCTVYELSRSGSDTDGIHHLTADVTREEQVRSAIDTVVRQEGRVDILIACAGFGIAGAAEMTASRDAHAQLEVNLFGADNAVRAVLPVMRAQRSGRIVCVSSVAGILPIPFQLWYSVSKAALNAYCLALQNEIRPFGIRVCAVLAGDVSTGFTGSRRTALDGDELYGGRIGRSVHVMEQDEQNGMSAAYAGRFVAQTALRRRVKPWVTLGGQYKVFAVLTKLLPRSVTNALVGKIYAK